MNDTDLAYAAIANVVLLEILLWWAETRGKPILREVIIWALRFEVFLVCIYVIWQHGQIR